MKVLLITSIKRGGIGGPALYADNLPMGLAPLGVETSVLRGLRVARFVSCVAKCDVVYSLSGSPKVNMPALLCAKIFRKKFLLRPGGDFLWERATQAGETEKNLPDYYEVGLHRAHKMRARVFALVLRGADRIIFPTTFLKELYRKHFGVAQEKCAVIDYPFPDVAQKLAETGGKREKIFLFAGRLIPFKNAQRLIESFLSVKGDHGFKLKIVGAGPLEEKLKRFVSSRAGESRVVFAKPLPHEELLDKIGKSWCVVIPSTFEPGSFFLLECLKRKTPVLFTKHGGLSDSYKGKLIFVDPYSVDDMREKIELVMQKDNHDAYASSIAKIDTTRSWSDVAKEHAAILKEL